MLRPLLRVLLVNSELDKKNCHNKTRAAIYFREQKIGHEHRKQQAKILPLSRLKPCWRHFQFRYKYI